MTARMCGIAGVLNWNGRDDTAVVQAMTRSLIHRGPDHQAVVSQPPIILGHTRLAIIDLDAASNQPMKLAARGLWIVFNGEIYNFRELRKELEGEGAVFRTQGDTEVILWAYAIWGPDCLKRLNGMFALAIWDEKHRRLLLARDRAGKKPLYFTRLPDGGLAFASELKALRMHPNVSDYVNPKAVGHFLSLNYTLTDECIIAGVEKLPPAHFLIVEHGKPNRAQEYWNLAAHFREKRRYRDEKEAADALRALLDDAVSIRLVSDVPLGAFLSGGIDSGAIVSAMANLQSAPLTKTFSIGFRERSYDEAPQARALAEELKVDHHERIIDAEMAGILPLLVRMADEPFADTSVIPYYYLSKYARTNVTVCLSGDGGDEMFAGYQTYVADRLRGVLGIVPRPVIGAMAWAVEKILPVSFNRVSTDFKIRRFLAGYRHTPRRAHFSWREINGDHERRKLLRPEVVDAVTKGDAFACFDRHFDELVDCDFIDQAMYVDAKTFLVDDVLVKVDRASMAHSLEARAPFLDYRIMEFAASLPVQWKLKGLRTKYLLKRSQEKRLARDVLDRPKRGFNAPVSHWLNGELGQLAYDASTNGKMTEWFQRRAIDELWTEHRANRRDNGLKLLGLACLGLWLQQDRHRVNGNAVAQ